MYLQFYNCYYVVLFKKRKEELTYIRELNTKKDGAQNVAALLICMAMLVEWGK